MPNGFHGSDADWQRKTDELRPLKPELTAFASNHGLDVEWHERNWPSWSALEKAHIRRLIQIFLDGENNGRWHLWICASQDREDGRYWKEHKLKDAVPLAEIEFDLAQLLQDAWREVSSWSEEDLYPTRGAS